MLLLFRGPGLGKLGCECRERWGTWRMESCESRVSHHTSTIPILSCRVSACSHSRETPPKRGQALAIYALAGGAFGDTLLQQTSMMVKPMSTVARAGGRPPALEAPIPTVNPLSHPHTPHEADGAAPLFKFIKRWERLRCVRCLQDPPLHQSTAGKVQWSFRAHLLSFRQLIRLFSLACRPAE
jgi:hypothetical protein